MPGRIHLALVVTLGTGAVALGVAGAADAMRDQPGLRGDAVLKAADGRTVGSLRVDDAGSGRSRVTVVVMGLPEGFHGFHIHAKGVCDPRSKDPATGSPFFSAGPHFDLAATTHPDHSGDLPALLVGRRGTGTASVLTDRFRVRQLFDRDGSSVIVHARADNHANIPNRYRRSHGAPGPDAETLKAGDSGGRVACGVITRR